MNYLPEVVTFKVECDTIQIKDEILDVDDASVAENDINGSEKSNVSEDSDDNVPLATLDKHLKKKKNKAYQNNCAENSTLSGKIERHSTKRFICPHCCKKFYNSAKLDNHIKRRHLRKKYKCELCSVTRDSLTELNKHMAIHNGEFRCDTCHRGFDSAVKLADHITRHDIVGKPYACFVCSIGYRSSQGLNKHLATVHRNEDIPKIAPQHLCTICKKVFEVKDKLNRHLKENHVVIVVGEIHYLEDSTNTEETAGDSSQNEILLPKVHEKETKRDCFDQLQNKKEDSIQIESKDKIGVKKNINYKAEVTSFVDNTIYFKNTKDHKGKSLLKENPCFKSKRDTHIQKKELNEIRQTANPMNLGNNSCLMQGLGIESASSTLDADEKLVSVSYQEANQNCDRIKKVNKLCHLDYKTTCDNRSFESTNSSSNSLWLPLKQNYVQPAHQSVVTSVFEQKQDFNFKNSYSNNFHSNTLNHKSGNEDFKSLENNHRYNFTSPILYANNHSISHKNFYNAMNFKITNERRDTSYISPKSDHNIFNPQQYANHESLSKDPIFPSIYNTTSSYASTVPHFFSHTSPIHQVFQNEKDAKQKLEIQDYNSQKCVSSAFKHVKNQSINCISLASSSHNNSNYISNSVLSKNNLEDASVNHISSLSRGVNYSNEKIGADIGKTSVNNVKNFQDKNPYR